MVNNAEWLELTMRFCAMSAGFSQRMLKLRLGEVRSSAEQ